jgi:ribonuclease T2
MRITPKPTGLAGNFYKRPGNGARLLTTWLLTASLCLPLGATARHRNQHGDSQPGDFAYYVLSLSWSPAYCLNAPQDAQCNGPRSYGFVVHGLWPQNEQGWPQYCNSAVPVPEETVQGVLDLMPARKLIHHEWAAHGTCSGLDPSEFFATVRRAYTSISIPAPMSAVHHSLQQPPAAVVEAFAGANPQLPPQSIVVTCSGQSVPRLREVHVCFDRDLQPRACSSDALREACRAPMLLIQPVR